MTTTTAPTPEKLATIAAGKPAAELHLAIYAAADLLAADPTDTDNTDLTTDDINRARAITTACQAELARRDALHTEALKTNRDVTEFLTESNERVLGAILDTHAHTDLHNGAVVTRQAMLDQLHQRAIVDRDHQAHLADPRATVRYLAGLIRQHGMDGEDIADMGYDQRDGMTLADRAAYPEVYTFLLAACDRWDVSGYDLLQDATVTVLGW